MATNEVEALEVSISGEARQDVKALAARLGVREVDVVTYALRILSDAAEAGVITEGLLAGYKTATDPRSYASSWVPVLRLYSVVSSAAPKGELQRVKRIIVESDGLVSGRRAIDWARDFERFSAFSW